MKPLLITFFFLATSCFLLIAQQKKIELFKSALKSAKTDSEKVRVLNELARNYLSVTTLDTVRAKEAIQQLKQYSFKNHDNRTKAIIQLREAGLVQVRKYFDAALKLFTECLHFCEKNHLPVQELEASVSIGNCLQQKKQHHEAITQFRGTLPVAIRLKDTLQTMVALKGLGFSFYSLAVYDSSIFFYSLLKDLAVSAKHTVYAGHAFSMLAIMYDRLGDYRKSIEYNIRAMEQYEMDDNKKQVANVLNNLANSYRLTGKYEEALKAYYKATAIREELKDSSHLASSIFNIGDMLKKLGRPDAALEYYQRALSISRKTGDAFNEAACYGGIADIYRDAHQPDSALHYHQEALALFEKLNDRAAIPQSLVSIGQILLKQKKYMEALGYFERAKPLLDASGMKKSLAILYNETGNLYFDQEKYNDALINYLNAYKVAHEIALIEGERDFSINLSRTYKRMGNPDSALKYMEISNAAHDSIMKKEQIKSMNELNTMYETEKKGKQIAQLYLERQQRELSLQGNRLALKQAELVNSNNQQQLEKSEATRILNELSLRQTGSRNTILQLERQKETELSQAEIKRKTLMNYILAGGIVALVAISVFGTAYFIQRQRVTRQREEIEKQKAVLDERNRIASDMHDDLGAGLSSIKMMGELAMTRPPDNDRVEIQKITQSASELIDNMRAIVWSISSRNDSVEDLLLYLRKYSMEYLDAHGVDCKMELPENIPPVKLSAEQRRNIFLVLKESLHNTVKHADATQVEIITSAHPDFAFSISDNGTGYNIAEVNRFGNGLKNMKRRMESMGGTFIIENNNGTTISCKCLLGNDKNTI